MSATFFKMTNEITLHRIKISTCVFFSEFYFAKKNLCGAPLPPKERKTRRKRKKNMQNSFVHTSNMLYSTSKTYQKERKKTQSKNPWVEKFTLQRLDW